jgi:hypothetical protein
MNTFGLTFVLLLLLTAPIARAQDDSPKPAGRGPYPDAQEPDTSDAEPLPLSGAREISLGGPQSQNLIAPMLRIMQTFDSNPGGVNDSANAASGTIVYGRIVLKRERQRSETRLRFGGGETFYPSQSQLNSNYQNFSIAQTIRLHRWTFLFAGELFHSPTINFGDLEHYTTPAQFIDETGLSQMTLPTQSIFTQQLSRLNTSELVETRYRLGPQTSFTASVGLSQLRFLAGGLTNINQYSFLTGINHALTARDTVTLAFGHNTFDLQGIHDSIHADFVEASYGHLLTGKLLFDVSLGPEVFKDAFGSGPRLFLSGHGSLEYKTAAGNLAFTFLRSITAGSGVVIGAQTNMVELLGTRILSRNWSGSAQLGYARNAYLQNVNGEINKPLLGGFAGLTISRTLSSLASLFFSYNLQDQNPGSPCLNCVAGLHRYQVIGGIDLRLRPIEIR